MKNNEETGARLAATGMQSGSAIAFDRMGPAAADGSQTGTPHRQAGSVQGAPGAAQSLAIQYIRGVAALLVLFYHQAVYLGRLQGETGLHDWIQARPGLYGVVAFFILSGYLMAEIAPKYAAPSFLLHRVTRIYPVYWVCVLLAHLLFVWLWLVTRPDASYVPNLRHMLFGHGWSVDVLRLTLAPMQFPDYPLGIEWTLLYETTFYVLVTLTCILFGARRLPHLALGWLALVLVATAVAPQAQAGYMWPTLPTFALYGINAGFILGLLGRQVIDRIPPLASIVVGFVLVVLADFNSTPWRMVHSCAGLAAIVLGFIALERRNGLPRLPWLRKLGDWSYAIYLVHVPLLLTVFKLLPGRGTAAMLLISTAVVVAVSAVVGEADLAMYRRLKRRVDGWTEPARRIAAGGFLLVFTTAAVGWWIATR